MKQSTLWLLVGIGAVVLLSIVGCCTMTSLLGDSGSSFSTVAASSEVDLEKLTKEFDTYVGSGKKDINGFEQVVNDKSKGIYHGTDHVDVTMADSGAVIGYVNKDTDPTYSKTADQEVFQMNVDEKEKRVVARDRHDHYYRHRPSSSGFFTGLLIGNMLTRHRGYYPGGYYRAPSTARYRSSGYYNRMRSSSRSRSRSRSSSFRSGSRSTYRSGSRSGGFGFGK